MAQALLRCPKYLRLTPVVCIIVLGQSTIRSKAEGVSNDHIGHEQSGLVDVRSWGSGFRAAG